MEVREHPASGSQPVSERFGLCFGSNELRQRRRVEIPDVQLALPFSHLCQDLGQRRSLIRRDVGVHCGKNLPKRTPRAWCYATLREQTLVPARLCDR